MDNKIYEHFNVVIGPATGQIEILEIDSQGMPTNNRHKFFGCACFPTNVTLIQIIELLSGKPLHVVRNNGKGLIVYSTKKL